MKKHRRSLAPIASIVLAVVVVAGLAVVVWTPSHRAFYLGGPVAPRSSGVGARPPVVPAVSASPREVSAAKAGATLPGTGRRRVPLPDAKGRVEVPVADQVTSPLPAEGAPAGWSLKEFAGKAEVELLRTDGRLAVKLRSERASFALYRDLVVDLGEFPVFTWSWKVLRLPSGGDARQPSRDDQAAQVYVIFPRWPSPLTRSDVIGYVWDTTAPVGTRLVSTKASNVKLIIVESGRVQVGLWRRYERNVAEDYASLFGRKPPRVGQVAMMIDSNDTRSDAETLVAGLTFMRAR